MLCCLLIAMLLAQVSLAFRRARHALASALRGRVGAGGGWRRPLAIGLVSAQAIAAVTLFAHWEHLNHEVTALLGRQHATAEAAPVICSSTPAAAAAAYARRAGATPG